METIKKIFNAVPVVVWVFLGLFLMVGLYWFSDDVGNWWEERKQAQFDATIAEKDAVINDLTKQRDIAIMKAEEAEAREQSKIIEADLLRQEASKRGINIEEAQKKIDAAVNEFQKDSEFIEQVRTGQISSLELCLKQCKDSAEVGYPCRVNYCDRFK